MIAMRESPKHEFIAFLTEAGKEKGLDELSSKAVGILYAEPGEVSLHELAERTGYSLSAVSTAMKFLENTGLARRHTRPKSRKVYFFMEKDIIAQFIDLMAKRTQNTLLKAKESLPGIIAKYKQKKSAISNSELRVIENYYSQILAVEKIMDQFMHMLETAHAHMKTNKDFRRKQPKLR